MKKPNKDNTTQRASGDFVRYCLKRESVEAADNFHFIFFEGDFLPMNELNISVVDATAMETAATGAVDTSSFISTACIVLKSVICLIGAGVGVWGVVNLLEGYDNDNSRAKLQ